MKASNIMLYLFLALIFALLIRGARMERKQEYKQTRAEFRAGEIILPDYAHDDTLIVINPDGLNNAIEKVSTDWEIDGVLHRFCAVMGQDMPDYGMDVDHEGYTLYDYQYKDMITVPWGTNFDSLMYNWND